MPGGGAAWLERESGVMIGLWFWVVVDFICAGLLREDGAWWVG